MPKLVLTTASGLRIKFEATIIDWNVRPRQIPRAGDGIDHAVQIEVGNHETWVHFRDLTSDDGKPLDVEAAFREWGAEGMT